MVYRSFLTGRSLASVETALQRAWVTLIEFYDPPAITIRRRVAGVWTDVATLTPITLSVNAGFSTPIGTGDPVTEIPNSGSMRVYVPNDIKRDDRFTLGTDTYVIGLVDDDDNHGSQVINFTMLEGQ